VFLNKCDLVDDAGAVGPGGARVRELLSKYEYPGDDIPVIRGRPEGDRGDKRGWGRWRNCWRRWTRASRCRSGSGEAVPDAVETVFSITGRGTCDGADRAGEGEGGEEVEMVGVWDGQEVVVTGVEMFRKLLDEGQGGDNVGLLLGGWRSTSGAGMVLAKAGSITPHTTV